MKKNDIKEEEIVALLKKNGEKATSDEFKKGLTDLIVERYQKEQVLYRGFEKYLGKLVLLVLICSNLLFFYNLKILVINPLWSICIISFILGFWILIGFMKRFTNLAF